MKLAVLDNGTEGLAYLVEHYPYLMLFICWIPTVIIIYYVMYKLRKRGGKAK